MAVRLNQILAGGSGVSRRVGETLAAALDQGAVPILHRPADDQFQRPHRSHLRPRPVGGPPLPGASTIIAALAFLVLRGNPEAYHPAVHATRAHPHQIAVAATLNTLVTGSSPALRIQDPFGLRVVPQVTAPALHAAESLTTAVTAGINAAAENLLVTLDGVRHHGQFHTATLASGPDALRGSLPPVLSLSAARLSLLRRPDMTGLRAFLADGPPGSSGLMSTEYVVQDLLAEMRTTVRPTPTCRLTLPAPPPR